jgi:RNA polymerase sigma-70 factor (ECF subfamily)
MILRKLEGLPQKEIAARLGLSEFTVQVHVVRGLQRLQELFRRMEISPPAP